MIPGLINKILTRQHQYYVILQQTRLLKSVKIRCCFKGGTSLEMVLKLVLSQAKHFFIQSETVRAQNKRYSPQLVKIYIVGRDPDSTSSTKNP